MSFFPGDIGKDRDSDGHPIFDSIAVDLPHCMMIAERLDDDERKTWIADAAEYGVYPTQIILIEPNSPAEYFGGGHSDPMAVLQHSWKDAFVVFIDDLLLWLPASEDFYVVFASDRCRRILERRRPDVELRLDEWIAEPHHSEKRKAFLRRMRERYGYSGQESS